MLATSFIYCMQHFNHSRGLRGERNACSDLCYLTIERWQASLFRAYISGCYNCINFVVCLCHVLWCMILHYEVWSLWMCSLSLIKPVTFFYGFGSKKEVIEPDRPTLYVTKIMVVCYAIFLIVDLKKQILDLVVVRNLHSPSFSNCK